MNCIPIKYLYQNANSSLPNLYTLNFWENKFEIYTTKKKTILKILIMVCKSLYEIGPGNRYTQVHATSHKRSAIKERCGKTQHRCTQSTLRFFV